MRFTKKDRYGHFYTNEANCRNIHSLDGKKLEGEFYENQTLAIDGNAIDKLGQLEDIEEELGIDLIILFKLFKYPRIWAYSNSGKVEVYLNNIDICEKTITLWNGVCRIVYPFSEYKKSWAFTKEELYD